MQSRFFLKKATTLWLTISTALLLLSACGQESSETKKSSPAMPPAQVEVVTMTPETVDYQLTVPATLAAAQEVAVSARITGVLEERLFQEGQWVKQGQSLFSIDQQANKLVVERQQAALNVAIARLEQVKRQVKRLTPLQHKNVVSRQQYEDAVSDLEVMQAQLASAKVSLAQAKLTLEYSRVLAPISGIVGRELISVGNFIASPNQTLTTLIDDSDMKVRFAVSAQTMLQMQQQAKQGLLSLPQTNEWQVKLTLADGTQYPEIAKVNFTDATVNRQTGSTEFQAIVANTNHQLKSGQFVRATLIGAKRHQVYVVPQQAVLDNGSGKFVYLMVKNKQGITVAKPQPVTVAEWTQQSGSNQWVILAGLTEGQQVITNGMARIFFPGMPVALAQPTTAKTKG
jgi:membrane fusion protein (multidrug efflux system)